MLNLLSVPARATLSALTGCQNVAAYDPMAIMAGVAGIAVIAAQAGFAPGRCATRIHPMEALRWE